MMSLGVFFFVLILFGFCWASLTVNSYLSPNLAKFQLLFFKYLLFHFLHSFWGSNCMYVRLFYIAPLYIILNNFIQHISSILQSDTNKLAFSTLVTVAFSVK